MRSPLAILVFTTALLSVSQSLPACTNVFTADTSATTVAVSSPGYAVADITGRTLAGMDRMLLQPGDRSAGTGKRTGAPRKSQATALTKQLVSGGFTSPVLVTYAPGDSTRLFIVQQDGIIRLIKNGTLLPTPFIDVSSELLFGGERGLLGLAFHPNYQSNGYFYLNFTDDTGGDTRISRYSVTGNPDVANPGSQSLVIEIDQPFSNHNGGMIAFGNDGYLYVGMGDGGSANDPLEAGQDPLTLLGKMLRLDVDNHPTPPPTNPWAGSADTLEYIWAFGLRNPWRFSFDRQTWDMYIGDVGQNTYEEISYEAAGGSGGKNFGWDHREGAHCFEPSAGCVTAGLTDPIHEYAHGGGNCSVTGGYVYRGCAIPDLSGTYFFGDYCTGNLWSIKVVGGVATEFTNRTGELATSGLNIAGFGEDYFGEIYICDLGGEVYKIVPNGVPSQCNVGGCCVTRGNVNGVSGITVTDLTYLVGFLFNSGTQPPCLDEANVNAVGGITVADLTYLVSFLYNAGPNPPAC